MIAGGLYFVLARADVRATAAVPESHRSQAARLGEAGAVHEGLIPSETRPRVERSGAAVEASDV